MSDDDDDRRGEWRWNQQLHRLERTERDLKRQLEAMEEAAYYDTGHPREYWEYWDGELEEHYVVH